VTNFPAETRDELAEPLTPVQNFVVDLTEELELGRRPVDVRCRRILFRLCRWATSQGIPLEREAIFDPEIVEHFCTVALANDRSRATHRSDLRRLGPKLTRKAPWQPRPTSMARRKVAVPYTAVEVEQLCYDALQQHTAFRRRLARALLALGLGAGLDGRWVGWIRGTDVVRRDGIVEVRVGAPAARSVIVRALWEDELLELAKGARQGYLIGSQSKVRNRVTDMAKRLDRPSGHPALNTARLRATWLVEHMGAGTRLPELCAAAGMDGFEFLSELLPFVGPLDQPVVDRLLRGIT
jgi:hypothetical protein